MNVSLYWWIHTSYNKESVLETGQDCASTSFGLKSVTTRTNPNLCVIACAPVCVVLTCPVILAVERPKCLCLSSWLHSAVASECTPACVHVWMKQARLCPFNVCGCVRVLCFWTCVRAYQSVIERGESWKVSESQESGDLLQAPSILLWQLPVAGSRLELHVNLGQLDPWSHTLHTLILFLNQIIYYIYSI